MCVCSLRYPASNAHAPYCRLWPAPLYSIFRHYLINGTIFEKVIEHKMCILISSSDFVWHISHSKKNWARYNQKCLVVFVQCTRYSSQILMKLEFSRQTLEKYSNIIFTKIRPAGAEFFHEQTYGRRDRHDEANTLLFAILHTRLWTLDRWAWDNVEKYLVVGQVTDDNMAHAHCTLDK